MNLVVAQSVVFDLMTVGHDECSSDWALVSPFLYYPSSVALSAYTSPTSYPVKTLLVYWVG
jgi:hypothetical protein